MKLRITKVLHAGEPESEVVIIRALRTMTLGHIILARARLVAGEAFSTGIEPLLWFPDEARVRAGDRIYVATGEGHNGRRPSSFTPGRSIHRYFLGANTPYWGEPQGVSIDVRYAPLLLEVADWELFTGAEPARTAAEAE